MHPKAAGLRLQERDFQILRAIAESPACSRANLALAFFNGSYEAAKKRLQQLAVAGFIKNEGTGGLGRMIISLTRKGTDLLTSSAKTVTFARTTPLRPKMQAHERMLADCQFAFVAEAKAADSSADFWLSPKEASFSIRCADHAVVETVRPDAFCLFRTGDERKRDFFFFEIDRGTEAQGHLVHLAKQYKAFWQSGEFAARFGNPYEPKRTSFRVLLVLTFTRRLANTVANLHQAGIRTLFWLTTFESFLEDPFGAIWECPSDHLQPAQKRRLFS